MKTEILNIVKEVFEVEAESIIKSGRNMDWKAFKEATALMSKAKRIAVSGCGHSGIACMHFAHSLCCIERPARFLSPAEAVHGGTGFLQSSDVLTVASRGGKTAELLPIMEIAAKKGAHIITVTENLDSPMARLSDVTVPMAVTREADRYNMQSTSSFVALSSIFDALQVAIMEETGYKCQQFALTHPGGAVGERFRREREI